VTSQIVRIAGDPDHPASRGFVCPKSQGLRGLRQDPDRLRKPLLRTDNGFREIVWEEALDRAAAGLRNVVARHGARSLGLYTGNPQAHIAPLQMAVGGVLGAMPALYANAGSIDNYPRTLVAVYLYGNTGAIPIPDVDRTDFFLIFGSNPIVSNGSILGASNMPLRLRKLRERGGRLVVVDPRRTETARVADDHLAIRPGSDALLALAMMNVMFAEGLVRFGRLASYLNGLDDLRAAAARFNADRVAPLVGVDAERIRQLARDFASARTAAAYSRFGACTQPFGSLAVWAVDCLNILTGNFDEVGGVMFPAGVLPIFLNDPYVGQQPAHGRWHSRVSRTPELGGTVTTTALWEEVETPGDGQIRGMLIVCGNPVMSNPNSARVSAALDSLEFLVAIDIYLNETTRHADLILPPMDHLKRTDFTMIWNNWMVEDIVCYSPAVFEREPGDMDDWEILMGLAARVAEMDPAAFERKTAEDYLGHHRPALQRFPAEMSIAEALDRASGLSIPEKIYDVMLRAGKAGDGFGAFPDGLSLARLQESPSGMNFGPMQPGQMPGRIDTPDGKLHLAPSILIEDLDRLDAAIDQGFYDPEHFMLIGRRSVRSNNSWMHNIESLAKGPSRCGAMISPSDAETLGIRPGDLVKIRSGVGEIVVAADVSDDVDGGVVCLPHGFSEKLAGSQLRIAHNLAGANVNVLHDHLVVDKPSGGASFSTTRITLERVANTRGGAAEQSTA